MPSIPQNHTVEFTFTAHKTWEDPFNQLDLSAMVVEPDGRQRRIPGFWAGGSTWKLRLSGHLPGSYRFLTLSSSPDAGLHHQEGAFEVTPYQGDNPFYRHGPLRVSADRRTIERADGTPYAWSKVERVVAGLCPGMDPFDPRAAGKSGFSWEKDLSRINPAYFDAVDEQVSHLVEQGLAPCVFGAWGPHLLQIGIARIKRHWRYLAARWGSCPGVIWQLAGDVDKPSPTSQTPEQDSQLQRLGWNDVASYLNWNNGYQHPVMVYPSTDPPIDDPTVLDLPTLPASRD